MLVFSANTFLVAVSTGLETVRPEIGAMYDGRSCALAVEPKLANAIDVSVAYISP
ncbi:MAG: hypothetical protein ACXU85_16545 [Xanthobacteraceae bacterium]